MSDTACEAQPRLGSTNRQWRNLGCVPVNSARSRAVRARIGARCGWRPAGKAAGGRLEDLDLERMTLRDVAGMLRAAVAAGAGRQGPKQIDLGEEFDVVARPHGARLHEILVRVAG